MSTQAKPPKPTPDYPLFPAANGQWARKDGPKGRKKLHYFGKWSDPVAALAAWERDKAAIQAGQPRPTRRQQQGRTVADAVNQFLYAKKKLVEQGELTDRYWHDLDSTCGIVTKFFGRDTAVSDVSAQDFRELRTHFAESWGPTRLTVELQKVRSIFNYAYESGLVDRPVRFGPDFKRPSAANIRKVRHSKGERLFTPGDIHLILSKCSRPLKAMVLLGLNCGFGNKDCSSLPMDALDLDGGWHMFGRPKTGIPRRCPLWPETVQAIREYLAIRPAPKDPENEGLVFISAKNREPWLSFRPHRKDASKLVHCDLVGRGFEQVLKRADIKRPGNGFYTMRHTFRTIGDGTKDVRACRAIMGHSPSGNDMDAVYVESISDDRLKAVTDYVREWLWPSGTAEPSEAVPSPASMAQ